MSKSPEINRPNEATRQIDIADYITFFSREASSPPGEDRIMGAFYTALADLTDNHQPTQKFLISIVQKRQLPPQHLTNLIFSSCSIHSTIRKTKSRLPLIL